MLIPIIVAAAAVAGAREITFPPIAAYQSPYQAPLQDFEANNPLLDPSDISTANFGGLTTFANLPYVHCLAKEDSVEKYDIAILGAPFDTVGTSGDFFPYAFQPYKRRPHVSLTLDQGVSARPGARFGPQGIRLGSRRKRPDFDFSV